MIPDLSIALAIPHTPWVGERQQSMARVRAQLGAWAGPYRELTERATNKVWPRRMWEWMISTGAEWCLSLQDDVLLAPYFDLALRAMIEHVPEGNVLGLSAVHPIGAEVARQTHRWYRTRSWLVGWAYAMRREDLIAFLAWCDKRPDAVAALNEDSLINQWVIETGRSTWHPVPTIVDHDTSIGSTYANDQHAHRRSVVTWRDYSSGSLCDPDFWLPSGEPQLLPLPRPRHCWFCGVREASARAPNGCEICRACVSQLVAALLQEQAP
jgi:hypothetical protein